MGKKEIFSKLLVEENLNERELEEIANLAIDFIEIHKTSEQISLKNRELYTISEKIQLTLIGTWIAQELGFSQEIETSLSKLSQKIGEKRSSLTNPLNTLSRGNILKKDDKNYIINSFKIKTVLIGIKSKYLKRDSSIKIEDIPTRIQKLKRKTKTKIKSSETKLDNKEIKENIPKNSLGSDSINQKMKKYNLKYEDLERFFNIDKGGNFILLNKLKGHNNKEIQLKNTLLCLTGCKIYFDLDELSSSYLRQQLEDLGIVGLVNLSTYLKKFQNCIIHKRGKRGNTSTNYKLTNLGFNCGIKLIKDSLSKTEEFDLFKTNKSSGSKGKINTFGGM